MAFTVDDFEDLVHLLEERPAWRARLRELLLPREILELPAAIAELAEISRAALVRLDLVETRLQGVEHWQEGADRRFDAIDGRFDVIDGRFDAIDGRLNMVDGRFDVVEGRLTNVETGVEKLTVDVEKLTVDVQKLTVDMDEVKAALRRLEDSVGEVRGSTWEVMFRANPDFYFSHIIGQPAALSRRQIEAVLEPHVSAGRLTRAEVGHIVRTDLIISGLEDDEPAFLVVEVSRTVSPTDVQRAADRAILLRKATPHVRPVVAGKLLRADAAELAGRRGVLTEAGDVVERDLILD